jgi:hypothetical protein
MGWMIQALYQAAAVFLVTLTAYLCSVKKKIFFFLFPDF